MGHESVIPMAQLKASTTVTRKQVPVTQFQGVRSNMEEATVEAVLKNMPVNFAIAVKLGTLVVIQTAKTHVRILNTETSQATKGSIPILQIMINGNVIRLAIPARQMIGKDLATTGSLVEPEGCWQHH